MGEKILSECNEPFCGTLALMIGQGPVTLSIDDGPGIARVKCEWVREEGPSEGRGTKLRDAVEDCCEKQFEKS